MTASIPNWALKAVTPADREQTLRAYEQGTLQLSWPGGKPPRGWAKQQGWPTPLFGFESKFASKMLEDDASFALALSESGVEMHIPRESYTLTQEDLGEFDSLYEQRSSDGRPTGWGALVAGLRDVRRAVEAGVEVKIAGTDVVLRSWSGFYDWAHGRYHMLEDGYDSWIGDDDT